MSEYDDIRYEVDGAAAVITINRPERYNAFRGQTVDELIDAFRAAWADKRRPGDDPHRRRRQGVLLRRRRQAARRDRRLRTDRERPVGDRHLHKLIRDIPKPVIAAVNGVAIGGGHVLHVICDLTIAADTARFGQAGPRVGSFDAGFGIGVPGARDRREAGAGDLVPLPALRRRRPRSAGAWSTRSCRAERADGRGQARGPRRSPRRARPRSSSSSTRSTPTPTTRAASNMAMSALDLFVESPEGREGAAAFAEKRAPDFAEHFTRMTIMGRLDDKIAVVTGAGQGSAAESPRR